MTDTGYITENLTDAERELVKAPPTEHADADAGTDDLPTERTDEYGGIIDDKGIIEYLDAYDGALDASAADGDAP